MIDDTATRIVMLESEVARLQARVAELEARAELTDEYVTELRKFVPGDVLDVLHKTRAVSK